MISCILTTRRLVLVTGYGYLSSSTIINLTIFPANLEIVILVVVVVVNTMMMMIMMIEADLLVLSTTILKWCCSIVDRNRFEEFHIFGIVIVGVTIVVVVVVIIVGNAAIIIFHVRQEF